MLDRGVFVFLMLVVVWTSFPAMSQAVSPIQDIINDVASRRTGFSDDLIGFGDEIDLQSGALSFRQVDVRLSGTGPSIEIERHFDVSARQDMGWMPSLELADWSVRLPRLYTNYREGSLPWEVKGANPSARCTAFGDARDFSIGGSTYPSSFWWKGYHLDVPGHPVQELMNRSAENTRIPNLVISGQVGGYNIVTNGGWAFTCLPGPVIGGLGEGFIGLAPDGTKYWFNVMTSRVEGDVVEPNFEVPIFVQRTVSLMASKVEDRFGNYVNYTYSNGLLTGIASSDGRRLSISWTGNRGTAERPYFHINQIVAQPGEGGERRWIYGYDYVTTTRGNFWRMSSITLPDTSQWQFNLLKFLRTCVPGGCYWDSPNDLVGTIKAPSGVVGIFNVNKGAMVIRNGEYTVAPPDPGNGDAYGGDNDKYSGPHLVKKTVEGPGVNLIWKYSYSPASDDAPYVRAKTYIENPDGSLDVYHLDSAWRSPTEGRIWIAEKYEGPVSLPGNMGFLKRRFIYEYSQASIKLGIVPRQYANKKKSEYIWREKKIIIEQDGIRFIRETNSFDGFGRPLNITGRSLLQ